MAGGPSSLSALPVSAIPAGVTTSAPPAAAIRSGSQASMPISALSAPTKNSRIDTVPPCAKNGRTRRSGFTPSTPEVSAVPPGRPVTTP
jgi:hypothetical protein